MTEANVELYVINGGHANWQNLSRWCEDIWEDEGAIRIFGDTQTNNYGTVVAAAHEIADLHCKDTWDKCELALETLRTVAGKLNPEWLD